MWYAALAASIGVAIKTPDPDGVRQELYKIRVKLEDPDLDGLSIISFPETNQIFIVKKVI